MRKPLFISIGLHLAVFVIVLLDLSFFSAVPERVVAPPIMVDISQVKITQKTNIPAKAKEVKAEKKSEAKIKEAPKKKEPVKEKSKPKTESKSVVKSKPEPAPKAEPVSPPKEKPTIKPEVKPVAEAKASLKEKVAPKPVKKAEPKVVPSRQVKKKEVVENKDIKSLLANIKKLDKKQDENVLPKEAVNKGIYGGNNASSYYQELTISEKEALSAALSKCWNLDAGVKGVYDIEIAIKVSLHKDAAINEVKIEDMARYNKDASFRSIAESAKRAVFICESKGVNSPFLFLAQKHKDKYELWREMTLYFNPMDANVF